jgi:pumilio family protein 6
MTKLAVHSVGSRVVELLFATFSAKSVAPLKLELYGPQYALFASVNPSEAKDSKNAPTALPTLTSFVTNNPDKREATVAHLQSIIQKGLDKSLTGFSYFHSLLFDYVSVASPNDIRDFLTPALAEHSLHLISTRAGTKVVCECAAYGTVKERKKILKCFKGYTRSSLLHRDAYLAILRLVDVMDDTVLVNKMLLAELQQNPDSKEAASEDDVKAEEEPSPILDLVLNDIGSKLFLLLLISKDDISSDDGKSTNRWLKNFDPFEIEVLHRNPCVTENGESAPTSKKEEETRRQELLVYLKELLVDACTKHTEELIRSKAGSKVLLEVCEQFPSVPLFSSLVDACNDSLKLKESGEGGDKYLTILEDPVGHLTLKHLFLAESKRDVDEDGASLARMFCSTFQNNFGEIASSNRGAFVLSSLIQVPSVKNDVKKALKGSKKDITKLAKSAAGAKVLLDALNAKK